MIGKKLNVENTFFYYDSDFEYKSVLDKYSFIFGDDILNFVDSKKASIICKPIITPYHLKGYFLLDYLFWFDDTDIIEIDKKIESDNFLDIDFLNSIKTQFKKEIKCLNCLVTYKNVLVVDSVLIYPNNFEIGYKKKDNLLKSNKICYCSNCQSKFNLTVVHIFGDNKSNLLY